jgi:hypothetical protein
MPDNKKDALTRRYTKHGIYSWVDSKRLPRGRAFQKVRRELSHLREELVQAHGGNAIGPDAQILVDSVIEGLGVQKILGLYIREYGVIDGQAAKQKRLELSPILGKNWISYANVVRQGVLALKEIEKGRMADDGPTIQTIIEEFDKEKAGNETKATEKPILTFDFGPERPVEARSPESAPDTTDKSDKAPGSENDANAGKGDDTR